MSTNRKVMLGVLGVAAVALILDNLPGPASADANPAPWRAAAPASTAPSPANAAPGSVNGANGRAHDAERRVLAQRMAELRQSGDSTLANVFAPLVAMEPDEPAPIAIEPKGDPRAVLAGVRVTAVVAETDHRTGRALVDGRTVRPGDTVRGWRVVQIRADGVVLTNEDGVEAVLRFNAAGRD